MGKSVTTFFVRQGVLRCSDGAKVCVATMK